MPRGGGAIPESPHSKLNIRLLRLVALGRSPLFCYVKLPKAIGYCLAGVETPPLVVDEYRQLVLGGIRPCRDVSNEAQEINPNDRRPLPVAGLTERPQVICPSIDGPPRDVYCLPGIEPLEAWVRQDALGLYEPP